MLLTIILGLLQSGGQCYHVHDSNDSPTKQEQFIIYILYEKIKCILKVKPYKQTVVTI